MDGISSSSPSYDYSPSSSSGADSSSSVDSAPEASSVSTEAPAASINETDSTDVRPGASESGSEAPAGLTAGLGDNYGAPPADEAGSGPQANAGVVDPSSDPSSGTRGLQAGGSADQAAQPAQEADAPQGKAEKPATEEAARKAATDATRSGGAAATSGKGDDKPASSGIAAADRPRVGEDLKAKNAAGKSQDVKVKDGDTVWGALRKAGYSDKEITQKGLVDKVAKASNLQDANKIKAGDTLKIPGRDEAGAPGAAAKGGAPAAGGAQPTAGAAKPGTAGKANAAGPTTPGRGGSAVDFARKYVGIPSYQLKGQMPKFTAAGGRTNNCADFVSSTLENTGGLKGHYVGVRNLESNLRQQGYSQVSASQAQPGDVWISNSRSHTELVSAAGGGRTIGSNNNGIPGFQRISERNKSIGSGVYYHRS